ncbi:dTDP-4-dehydrorhamnose reductase [Halothece sp. PCC 7418]|uniref:dTDP-4-dehydrorhamnose reductase n=1 Tax=Halothece sp. (strain PCC 7418) TaxID=65093 RepID=UPI0002A07E89|nr:dTDP-4-dehydrorhamnose reductase [Halothece sp. PCC 7418]AFZ45410.1 dTDP-4-dehydrorhamnose reductase [Halothece sp. PCC 7418]
MTKILLTGKNGQLGQDLQPLLRQQGELIALGKEDLDLSNLNQIRDVIKTQKPDLIINSGAYTAVDQAESEPDLAQTLNGDAPRVLAECAEQIGARLFHISTDYVFDGEKNQPYTEEDQPNPIGVYGQSKLAGEVGIQNNCQNYVILRTAWVYGTYGKKNFVKTMLRLGAEREELKVVSDQVGTPSWTYDIAQAVVGLMTHLPTSPIQEIYHFTNSGVTSWYDFSLAIFEEAQALKMPINIKQVFPISTPEYPTPAQRPPYSVLSNHKIAQILGTPSPQWRVSLRKMLSQLSQEK